MGFNCVSCNKHFCNSHKYAESHGCRSKQFIQTPGRSAQIKKKQVENKLKTKITEMEGTRKSNQKKKK